MKKKLYRFNIVLLVLISVVMVNSEKRQTAELVLLNGKIVTMDASKPVVEALAVNRGRILTIGGSQEIKSYISGSTQVIDLKGKLAIPGFIESHGHFTSLGHALMKLDLMKVKNWDQIIDLVAEAVSKAEPGEWILGRGWHQEKWNRLPQAHVNGLPTHHSLSKISSQNPVLLTHASGHSCFANAAAMALAGIDESTPDPEGGEIVRDKSGRPIGVFRETAQAPLRKALNRHLSSRSPEEVEGEQRRAFQLAVQTCLENGVTSFHDAGTSFKTIDILKEMVRKNQLRIRLNVMIGESNEQLRRHISRYRIIGMGDHHLTVRCIKRLIDGALGSHGAWLLEPYLSLPDSCGLNTEPVPAMKETAAIAIKNGFQLATHAIGDRANRETLDVYEAEFKRHPDKKNLRWRIEHAQHLHPDDLPRFARSGVIAVMQGIHCTSDGPWVIKRLGEKRAKEGAYMWRNLIDSGAVIANSTDVPVENIDPIACFYASVTRRMKNGNYFYPGQRMSREEALRSYTINGAYASFEENIKGSLSPGKLADITVLSKDIMTVPDEEILQTEINYTIVGGRILYKKQ